MTSKEGNGKTEIVIDAETAAGIVFLRKLLALSGCVARFAVDGENGKSKSNGIHTITREGMLNALRMVVDFEDWVEPGSPVERALEILKRKDGVTIQTIFSDGGLDGVVKPRTLAEKLNGLATHGLVVRGTVGGKNTYSLSDPARSLATIVDAIFASGIGQSIMEVDTAAELGRLSATEEVNFEPKK